MKTIHSTPRPAGSNRPISTRCMALLLAGLSATLLSGCAGNFVTSNAPVAIAGARLSGSVYGGQQPVGGAQLFLYAASTAGYGAQSSSLFSAPVYTTAAGNFNLGSYTCTPGQQLYLVATGGDPGGGTNPNLVLMAVIGECTTLTSSSFVAVNEITTVASAYALAPFMTGYSAVATDSGNTTGLAHAFANFNKLATLQNGQPGGSALPAGASVPVVELNTLADILATCVNSTGGSAGDGSACGTLFSLSKPANGAAPADTVAAALSIAKNPTLNVSTLWKTATPKAPYQPTLAAAPTDWTVAVTYTPAGLNKPQTTTIDAGGRVWIANAGNNTVSVLQQTGAPAYAALTGNGLSGPSSVAIDAGGNAWVGNAAGTTVSAFAPGGSSLSGSPFNGAGTVSAPSSVAIDAPGNIWISNRGNSSVTELTSTGAYLQQVSTGVQTPTSLAINPK